MSQRASSLGIPLNLSVAISFNSFMFPRWKFEHGKVWQHLGGELNGQTHVAYCKNSVRENIVLSHPIDMHFAVAGLQVGRCIVVAIAIFLMRSYFVYFGVGMGLSQNSTTSISNRLVWATNCSRIWVCSCAS